MQLALRQICWPLSHRLGEAPGHSSHSDSLELLTDRCSFAHQNLTVCLLRIIQVHRLYSTQPSVRVTFTQSVFLWKTLLSLDRNPKIHSCKSFLFLIRGGTRHRWRQELRVDLQGLPARIYFKSHNWMCILTVLRRDDWDNPSYFLCNKILLWNVFRQKKNVTFVRWKFQSAPESVKEAP